MTMDKWRPLSEAPSKRLVLVVYRDRSRALSWFASDHEGFSACWWVHQRHGREARLGKLRAPFPVAWMEIPDAPSFVELEEMSKAF